LEVKPIFFTYHLEFFNKLLLMGVVRRRKTAYGSKRGDLHDHVITGQKTGPLLLILAG